MNSELSAYEALIQFLYQAPIGLLQTRLDGEILMINPMSAQLLMPLVPDGNLLNLFDALAAVAPELREQAAAYGPDSGVICESLRIAVAPGERRPLTLELRLLRLDRDTLMASVSDVTQTVAHEHQRLALQLHDATHTDRLTALPNRAVALERIEQALASSTDEAAHQFAVLFINVDRFHGVNSSVGPAVGDELLRLMAGRLRGALPLADGPAPFAPPVHTAARLGGDEFVLVIDGLRSAEDVHGVAQRLVESLAKPYGIGAHQLQVGASIGLLLRAQAVGDAEAVLQDASIAMREAKRSGGARYCVFEPPMKERAARRGSIESELRQALDADELFVVYQPIIDLRQPQGPCSGVEALVRWRHPRRGIVPPIEFIEIAEETGLIGRLGAFVLRTACQQFVAWQRDLGERAPGLLSVNLSRAQLGDPGLVEQVRSALSASGLAPDRLQLEVTESLAAQDDGIQAMLHGLKAIGLSLALDDFGTGYSSLASLHLLPVDVVKIDRSFVSQAETSAHHRVLIEATVRVANSLQMRTVAEGIETAGQAEILAALQCDKGQGYWYARPLTAEDATGWLSAR